MRRVVVTGLGMVTALGNDVSTTWQGLIEGRSGIDKITYFDTQNYAVKVAAQVKGFDPTNYMPAKEVRRLDYHQHYMVAAAQEALQVSGFEVNEDKRHKTSVIVASSTGGLKSYAEYIDLIRETGNPRKMTPFAIPMLVVNAGGNIVSMMMGAMGPSAPVVSACATGGDNIGYAFHLIRSGRIDNALAGCADYPIIDLGIAAFDRIGACSRVADDPVMAMRPFDKDRKGMVFGEGAGVMMLEELSQAKTRGANILAEVVGYGSTTDAFHRTAPHPDGIGASYAIQLALEDAQIAPTMLDYINAHGTATAINDPIETKAVKRALGQVAYDLPMSSTKSMTGHAMGATAAIEACVTVKVLQENVAPPTINLSNPDPDCDLDYIPNQAREISANYVMSNAFGFGGHNASLIFKAFRDE
jgi:3-oxoacyl-[acyl-carrier-protein] synthase II